MALKFECVNLAQPCTCPTFTENNIIENDEFYGDNTFNARITLHFQCGKDSGLIKRSKNGLHGSHSFHVTIEGRKINYV